MISLTLSHQTLRANQLMMRNQPPQHRIYKQKIPLGNIQTGFFQLFNNSNYPFFAFTHSNAFRRAIAHGDRSSCLRPSG